MSTVGGLRDKLQGLYGRHSHLIDAIGRFLLAGGMCFLIREAIGFHPLWSNPLVLLIVSLIAATLPVQMIPILGGALITVEAFAVDLVAGGVSVLLFLVLFLFFLRFVPEELTKAVLTPMSMYFHLDAFIPIYAGLVSTPAAIFSVCPGAVIYSFVLSLKNSAEEMKAMPSSDYLGKAELLLKGALTPLLAVELLSLAVCLLAVYFAGRLSANYAPYIAVLLGGAAQLLTYMAGSLLLKEESGILLMLIGTAASMAAAYLILLIRMPLRYAKSEYLRFEDENYCYYVKAIPKAHGRDYPGESGDFHPVQEGDDLLE